VTAVGRRGKRQHTFALSWEQEPIASGVQQRAWAASSLAKLPLYSSLLSGLIVLIAAVLSAQQSPSTDTIGAAPVQIDRPRPNYLFPDGRSYVYSAEWHLITPELAKSAWTLPAASAKSPRPPNLPEPST